MKWILGILLFTNLAAFALMGIDKRRAVRDSWRISEKTLLTACGLFAAAGGLLGMHVFHHKTRKIKFFVGVPVMLVVQLVILVGLYRMVGLA